MVDCSGLENRRTRERFVGSNPTASSIPFSHPSSSGPGRCPFKAETRVRPPLGVPFHKFAPGGRDVCGSCLKFRTGPLSALAQRSEHLVVDQGIQVRFLEAGPTHVEPNGASSVPFRDARRPGSIPGSGTNFCGRGRSGRHPGLKILCPAGVPFRPRPTVSNNPAAVAETVDAPASNPGALEGVPVRSWPAAP